MAHVPRLYLTDRLGAGERAGLDEAQARYLTRVMRLDTGAVVRAFNGIDGEWQCALEVDGRRASLRAGEQTREQSVGPDLTLMFAPLKKARTDFVVEKACELGAARIQPVITAFTQSERIRTDRLQAIAIEASEQTERLDVPTVMDAVPLAKALAEWDPARPLYFCDEGGDAAPMAEALQAEALPGDRRTGGILIGPEGGFSPAERKHLRSIRPVVAVTLGPRILRAETAALSALSLWQSLLGDWSKPPYLPR